MPYLYENLINELGRKTIDKIEIPSCITDNLNPKFGIRPYQTGAFQHFLAFDTEDFTGKPLQPYHLMFNMATGSGKTLIMAGLLLYLFKKGFRNFLFFVHSNTILDKTKDNFLNYNSSKYLFNKSLQIDGKNILIKEVQNFDEADKININIHFTTIQKLHSDLIQNEKENALSLEDFENKEIVLLGDEAHHYNANTQSQIELFKSWEKLITDIHQSNFINILLEFTATLDYENKEIIKKYEDKIIYKYDLKQFRLDKYSKEINLVRSHFDENERILQAIILNQYRQELATANGINLKPVILFKAKKTIKESEQNKTNFHQLINKLSVDDIENIRSSSSIEIVQKAFTFFEKINLDDNLLIKRLKNNFKFENCLSANDDKETESNQIRLNTLEDDNNPIRAIFAVQKLNEGWDVLNLFDIVRLYEGQNTGGSNKDFGATTIAEAQLIGRGARYFPFVLDENQEKFKRKYDDDIDNDFKILEELYYHAKDESRYISEIKKALIEFGSADDENNLIDLFHELKEEFKTTDFYKTGSVVFNKKIPKRFDNVILFKDLSVSITNFVYRLTSGFGTKTNVYNDEKDIEIEKIKSIDVSILNIQQHVIAYALHDNPFYQFNNISEFYPELLGLIDFINNKLFLGGLKITIFGSEKRISEITNVDYYKAIKLLLKNIENDIKNNLTEFEGSDFIHKRVNEVFKNKTIRVPKDSEREKGQIELVLNEPWFVYKANYGTIEEKNFVALFARRFKKLELKYDNIYLLRNEREIKIIDKFGNAFEPDYILFCKQKEEEQFTYQIFIEPKGNHLRDFDKWKENFLINIKNENKIIVIESDKYKITGVPFYNRSTENDFVKQFETVLAN